MTRDEMDEWYDAVCHCINTADDPEEGRFYFEWIDAIRYEMTFGVK